MTNIFITRRALDPALSQAPADAAKAVPGVLAAVSGGAELTTAKALLAAADDRVRVAGAARLRRGDGCPDRGGDRRHATGERDRRGDRRKQTLHHGTLLLDRYSAATLHA